MCIGDGMGLSQIYVTYTANSGQVNIFQMLNIGFSVTNSADAYITDSAAGGTAIAGGQKTNDRAVGVDANGKPLKSLADYSAEEGKKTADIVVCELTDATPAVFYAHQAERSMAAEIANDITKTPIDILLGSGYKDFTNKDKWQNFFGYNEAKRIYRFRNFNDFLNLPDKRSLL